MPSTESSRVPLRAFVGIALLSASLLAFQVLLTRACALRLHFHFSFLVISNSLLGIGASGTLLTLIERRWRELPDRWIWRFSALYVVSLIGVWAFLLTFSVPNRLTFDTLSEALRFGVFNTIVAIPFFFGGAAVGLILSVNARRVHLVYSVDLLGAGVGCLLCPLLLWPFGAGGCLAVVVLLGLIAVAAVAPAERRRTSLAAASVLGAGCLAIMPFLDQLWPMPGKLRLDLTQEHSVNTAENVEYSRWSANSRIDVVPAPEPGGMFVRGAALLDVPMPPQKWVLQDGSAGTLLTDFTRHPEGLDILRGSLYSLSAKIKEGQSPRVFIIGVGGGHDVWAAKVHGASRVRAVELNEGVLEVHKTLAAEYSKGLLDDPHIELIADEGRTALMRETDRYDIVQMTGIDTWTALTSGAYVLAENYLYTVEAIREMYRRLADGGILQVTRMGAQMEMLRLLANMHAALESLGVEGFADSVAVLVTVDQLATILLKKGAFEPSEIEVVESFVDGKRIFPVCVPDRDLGNAVERFVRMEDKQAFIDSFPRNISPTTDNQPYFFNYTRWTAPLDTVQFVNEPVSLSQGNPFFLVAQLAFSTLLAVIFIVLPLGVFRRGGSGGERPWRFLLYFACLGIGFIAVEVAMIQKLTLLLGQPLYSIVVTLFSILVFTGVGSMVSKLWLSGGVWRARLIPLGLLVLLLLVVVFGPTLVDSLVGLSLIWRSLGAAAIIAPIALLLGMPFAHGISLVERVNPSFVPWAWAINGSATVVGSVATVIVSMNLGFNAVLLTAAAIYLVAFAAVDRDARS